MRANLRPAEGHAFPLRVVRLQGSQEEMGRRHGELVVENGGAPSLSEFYADLPKRLMLGPGAEPSEAAAYRLLEPVLDRALWRLESRRDPVLRGRSRAFLAALGEDPDMSRRLAVMDLFQNLVGIAIRAGVDRIMRRLQTAIPGMCSTLMVNGPKTSDGRVLHARTFDFPGIGLWERAPTVVFCTPSEGVRYGFLTTFGADLPGITAFNEAGITLTAHTRFHRDVSFSGTQIIDLGHEIVRRSESLSDAISIARSLGPIASTWGLAISSAREGLTASLETHATRVDVVTTQGGIFSCSNHYQHPKQQVGELLLSDGFAQSSMGRMNRMIRGAESLGVVDVADLQSLLGSYEDADLPGVERSAGAILAQGSSIQAIVADLARNTLHVSVGPCPAGGGPWVALDAKWTGPEFERIETDAPVRSDLQGAAGTALGHYVEATRLAEGAEALADVRLHLERAVTLQPDDPSYRLAAGLFAAKAGAFPTANAHFEHGLVHERAPFVRAQFFLWGSRVSDALGDLSAAERARSELIRSEQWFVAEAEREQRKPFDRRIFRSVRVSLEALDAG